MKAFSGLFFAAVVFILSYLAAGDNQFASTIMLYAESENDVSENYDVLDIVSNGRNLRGRGGGRSSGGRSSGSSSRSRGGSSGKTRSSVRTYLYGSSHNRNGSYDDDEECEEITYTDGTTEVECGNDEMIAIVISTVISAIFCCCISCYAYKNCYKKDGNKKVANRNTANDEATLASSQ